MMVAFVVLYIYALKFEYFPPHYLVRSIYLSNFFFFFLKITNSLLVHVKVCKYKMGSRCQYIW